MAELNWYISANPIANNDSNGSGSNDNNLGGNTPNQESTNGQQNKSLARSTAQILAVSTAKRSISYLTSNVGKYSGNSRNQTIMNNITKMAGYAVAFAVNPALGAATVALDSITYGINLAYEQKMDRIRSNQAKARAGEGVGLRR
jgi:hypothetical protein